MNDCLSVFTQKTGIVRAFDASSAPFSRNHAGCRTGCEHDFKCFLHFFPRPKSDIPREKLKVKRFPLFLIQV